AEVGHHERARFLAEHPLVRIRQPRTPVRFRVRDPRVASVEEPALQHPAARHQLRRWVLHRHSCRTGGQRLHVGGEPLPHFTAERVEPDRVDGHCSVTSPERAPSWHNRSRCQVGSPYSAASEVSRRRYRCWSCSQVKPIPPKTWKQVWARSMPQSPTNAFAMLAAWTP